MTTLGALGSISVIIIISGGTCLQFEWKEGHVYSKTDLCLCTKLILSPTDTEALAGLSSR